MLTKGKSRKIMGKKDIGKLISERLKEVDKEPNEAIWSSIERKIEVNTNYRKTVVFFLMRYGIPMLSVLILFLSINYLNNDNKDKNTVNEETIILNGAVESQNNTKASIPNVIKENSITNKEQQKHKITNETKSLKIKNSPTNYEYAKNTKVVHSKVSKENPTIDKSENIHDFYKMSFQVTKNENINKGVFSNDSIQSIKNDSIQKNVKIISKSDKSKAKDSLNMSLAKTNYNLGISLYSNVTSFSSLNSSSIFGSSIELGSKQPKATFNYGLYLNCNLQNRFGLRLGLFKTDLDYLLKADANSNNIIGINYTPSLKAFLDSNTNYYIKQSMRYLEVPFEFMYTINNQKVSIYTISGLSYSYLKKNEVLFYTKEVKDVSQFKKVKSFNVSVNLGIGTRFKIEDKFHLSTEAVFKKQFFVFDNRVNFSPYTLNLMLGLNYNF